VAQIMNILSVKHAEENFIKERLFFCLGGKMLNRKHRWEHRCVEGSVYQTIDSLAPWDDDIVGDTSKDYTVADSLWGSWHIASTSIDEDHVVYIWRRLLIKKDNLYHPPNPIE